MPGESWCRELVRTWVLALVLPAVGLMRLLLARYWPLATILTLVLALVVSNLGLSVCLKMAPLRLGIHRLLITRVVTLCIIRNYRVWKIWRLDSSRLGYCCPLEVELGWMVLPAIPNWTAAILLLLDYVHLAHYVTKFIKFLDCRPKFQNQVIYRFLLVRDL